MDISTLAQGIGSYFGAKQAAQFADKTSTTIGIVLIVIAVIVIAVLLIILFKKS